VQKEGNLKLELHVGLHANRNQFMTEKVGNKEKEDGVAMSPTTACKITKICNE